MANTSGLQVFVEDNIILQRHLGFQNAATYS